MPSAASVQNKKIGELSSGAISTARFGGVFFVAKKVTGRRGGRREGRGGEIKLEIALTSRTICKGNIIADFLFAVFPPRRKADPVRGDKSLKTNLQKYKPL